MHLVHCSGLLPTSPWFTTVSTFCSTLVHCTGPISVSPALPRCSRLTTAMVRTRGGSPPLASGQIQYSRARGAGPSSSSGSRTLYQLQSPRQSLRSLRGSGGTRRGWDPGPHHLCLSGDLGGPGPPSGPAHPVQVSHPHPDLSRQPSHISSGDDIFTTVIACL